MALMAEPIYYASLRRNAGAKRKIVYIENPEEENITTKVTEMSKPEWVEIEGVQAGTEMEFPKGKRTPLVVNLNTGHKFFPKDSCRDEKVSVTFEDGTKLDIGITIPEIIGKIEDFRGVFAVDFGTSNSCYAVRGQTASARRKGFADAAKASPEIPSVIFFHDVSDAKSPRYSVGREAKFDIKENSWQTYSYLISSKRLLGKDQNLMMLDRMAGAKKEHRQEWHVEDITSFILREMIERAQEEIGERIFQVVATFPPLFSQDRREALKRAYYRAFKALGMEITEESLIMDLDEANAAAFNYIYGTMLNEFRQFESVTERKARLLSFDFGGGTIDISLVDVNIQRDPETRMKIIISTNLLGLSGDPDFGGDNVTLGLFSLMKNRMAIAAAKLRVEEMMKSKKPEKKAKAAAGGDEDIWGTGGGEEEEEDIWGGGGEKKEEEEDLWGAAEKEDKEEEKEEEAEVVEEEEEIVNIENTESEEEYGSALETVAKEAEIVEKQIAAGTPVLDLMTEQEKADGSFLSKNAVQKRAEALEEAIETVLPTMYASYEDKDPFKMEVARKLFHEIWHEADLLKIRMSSSAQKKSTISGVMKQAAKYIGVKPMTFNELEFTMGELDTVIQPMVKKMVERAHKLVQNAAVRDAGGISIGGEGEETELRILVFGNSSNLPIVRRMLSEEFQLEEDKIIFDKDALKNSVARGACEEYGLRKQFGEKGFIQYKPSGFLDRIPFSVGLMHKDLALLGFPGGYCPIFQRGSTVGLQVALDENSNFLIHSKMRELELYADYRDGADPLYIGWFDFTDSIPENELPPEVKKAAQVEEAAKKEEEKAAAEGEEKEEEAAEEKKEEEKAAAPAEGAGAFTVRFTLLASREVVATDVQTGKSYKVKLEKITSTPQKDPFSGVH